MVQVSNLKSRTTGGHGTVSQLSTGWRLWELAEIGHGPRAGVVSERSCERCPQEECVSHCGCFPGWTGGGLRCSF